MFSLYYLNFSGPVDRLETSLQEPTTTIPIVGSVIQPELHFVKSHVSRPIINILTICKKDEVENDIVMVLMAF
jgi:hypothetical protein